MSNASHKLVEAIHASRRQAVVAVTGGGSLAISDLLTVAGASAFLLEAVVPYSSPALTKWLGREPEQFCGRDTALAMATVALRQAQQLAPAAEHPVGLSCTASLVSDRPKRGDHRAWIAAQTLAATWLFGLKLDKGHRDRFGEERLVADLLLRAAAEACGVLRQTADFALTLKDDLTHESIHADPHVAAVCYGRAPLAWSLPSGAVVTDPRQRIVGLLPGAFNPLHDGHRQMASAAERLLGGCVAFELSVINVDKPPLDFLTLETRRLQFTERPLALSAAPTFVEKSRLFPNTTFVVGIDTAERIVQPKYYHNSESEMLAAVNEIRSHGCRFLVAGRRDGDSFRTLRWLVLPESVRDLFEEIPESEFRLDVSSTELRRRSAQTSGECRPA